jgi:hypothetical protein
MKNWLLFGLLCGWLAGCAAPKAGPQSANAKEEDDKDMICHEESQTGSSITRKVCRPRPDVEDEREETRRGLTKPRASPTAGGR